MSFNVGKKITNFRRSKDLTIRELAEMTGLSTSLISQLERGIGNPTLSALSALAVAMGITLADLVSAQIENRDLVCRRENRSTLRRDENLTLWSMLVENSLNTSLTVLEVELSPHAQSSPHFEVHPEEECLCVTEGAMVMMFENEEFVLCAGDSIRVLPNRHHKLRNDGEQTALAINIKCKVQY